MPDSFPKPSFKFDLNLKDELANLKKHNVKRAIPVKKSNSLLLATWNIANLGGQDRTDNHYKLIAEIISWYDVIAIQEVKDNLSGLRGILKQLPKTYATIFSDRAGNNERMAFIYDTSKVKAMEKFGEVNFPVSENKNIKLPGNTIKFEGFDRSPFIGSFKVKNFLFVLVNVHLYYGDVGTKASEKESMKRRSLETYAVARWAALRRESKNKYTDNIIALGDFNLPKTEKGDVVYDALISKGLLVPDHSTKVYSNISNDSEYDQIAFFPGLKSKIKNNGVFDFDSALFPKLFQNSEKDFKAYTRYYMSDHRLKWVEIAI